jgi:pyridoxamine 5'-phosphate oxidase
LNEWQEVSHSIAHLRVAHTTEGLSEDEVDPDPMVQFSMWMQDALDAGVVLPNAMTLATATEDGSPSARMVLLKGFGPQGFVFYTNYGSRKVRELDRNPRAALVFYWHQLERQVRVGGRVERVSQEESDDYFSGRPVGSKLSAWASRQSEVVEDREQLEAQLQEVSERLGTDVPRPPFWGGLRLVPEEIEFWQGMPNRLHDRLLYARRDQRWRISRLSP